MGALFLALHPSSTLRDEHASRHLAVRSALQRRHAGPVRRFGDAHCLLLVSGRDVLVHESSRGVLAVDGRLGTTPGEHEALVGVWQREHVLPLQRCNGQFAAVAWDAVHGAVSVVRDRFGTRPVVWCEAPAGPAVASAPHRNWDGLRPMLVASEPSILHAAGVELNVDPAVLADALQFRWLTGSRHLLAPVQQVPVAHHVSLGADTPARSQGRVEPQRYWQMSFAPQEQSTLSMPEAVARTRQAMRDSLESALAGGRRPVVLLSGGVDSSIIAAVVREVAPKVAAVTASLPDGDNPELHRARFVAEKLRVPLRVVPMQRPGAAQFAAMVERLQELPRNPNNVVLQQLLDAASDEGDMALQGDGAEVVFGLGDTATVRRFVEKRRVATRALPASVRRLVAAASAPVPGAFAARARRVLTTSPESYAASLPTIHYHKAVRDCMAPAAIHARLAAQLRALQQQLGNDEDALHVFQMESELMSSLVRHDRLSQSAGIDTVPPFLLPAVVGVGQQLPRELRNAGRSRAVLRELCDALLPAEVSRWPKLGFEVPWAAWLAPLAAQLAQPHAAWELLPARFVQQAVQVNDAEAMWSALALRWLVERFVDGLAEGEE